MEELSPNGYARFACFATMDDVRPTRRAITFLTLLACHCPPRAVRTPRLLRAMAMPSRVVMPDAGSDGSPAAFERQRRRHPSVIPPCFWRPQRRCSSCCPASSRRPFATTARRGSLRGQPPLLLGECSIKVEHERLSVGAELRNNEGYTAGHQAGDEGNVAREPIELGNHHRAFLLAGGSKRGGELWPSVKRVPILCRFPSR